MKDKYLGDSYDVVKRLWQQALKDWAPLYANPDFIPIVLRTQFTKMTLIEMQPDEPETPYSIFNDPDTGIRLPNGVSQTEGTGHIRLQTIVDQLRESAVRCVVTFDQSYYRSHKFGDAAKQREIKMRHLAAKKCQAFYYESHAPFLFAFRDEKTKQDLRRRLISFGLPNIRIRDIPDSF